MRLFRSPAFLLVMLAMAASIGVLSASSRAEACATETENVRRVEPYGSQLSDCRAYEQVSPVDKNETGATGEPGFMESSPNGEVVSYTSTVPFPVATGSSEFTSYLSVRGGGGWLTQGLNALTEPAAESSVRGLTANDEEAIVFVSAEENERFLLAPGAVAGHGNAYVRNNITGTYELLAPRPSTFMYVGSTPDGSHILFTSNTEHELVPGIVDEKEEPYLYEWTRETGQVSFVGYVKNGHGEEVAPEGGTVAGSNERVSGELAETYAEDVISENGGRIFFSEVNGAGRIYMREPNADPARTVEISEGNAQWRGATFDGSKVFYTEGENPEKNLYEYNVETGKRSAITEGAAGVLGVAGISASGSYAYFAAEGALAANENHNQEKAEQGMGRVQGGKTNLYEWHEGAPITFIAKLKYDTNGDEADWLGYHASGDSLEPGGYKGSRVSNGGTRLLISSRAQLTSYDNAGYEEIYLYDAPSGELRCVSCNPVGMPTEFNREGVPAASNAYLALGVEAAEPAYRYVFTNTRNLSAEGTRVFFQTGEALLPRANAKINVYEWEQEGVGSCKPEEGVESGGCLSLISTGQSTEGSEFLDASENGDNVFFFTRQSLVGQDQDESEDVYDARENGGIAAQNPQPSPQPCAGEACRGSGPVSGPVFGAPYSATFSGSGNLASSPVPPTPTPVASTPKPKSMPAKCKRGLTRTKNKCVKKSRPRKKAKKSAHTDRRTGR
jgi:hypothetical protein